MPLIVSLLHWFHQNYTLLINSFLLSLLVSYFIFSGPKKALQSKRGELRSLPSPPRVPVIGNLHQLGSLAHRSLQSLSEKYGPVMLFHFGRIPTVIVSSPQAAQEVMKTQDLAFASRPKSSMADGLLYNSHDVAFSPYGEYWRQVRRICVVHLLGLRRVQSYRLVREEEVAAMIDDVRRAASSTQPVNLSKLISTLTYDIICRVAFGRKYHEEEGGENGVREMLSEFTALLGTFPMRDFIPWLGWVDWLRGLDARVRNTSKQIDCLIDRVIEDHLHDKSAGGDAYKDSGDFVDVLLSLDDDKDHSIGSSLGKDSIKALIMVSPLCPTHFYPFG